MMCVDDDDRNDCSTVAPMTINYCQIGCDGERLIPLERAWVDDSTWERMTIHRLLHAAGQIQYKYRTNTGQILLMTMVKEFIGSQRVEYDSV